MAKVSWYRHRICNPWAKSNNDAVSMRMAPSRTQQAVIEVWPMLRQRGGSPTWPYSMAPPCCSGPLTLKGKSHLPISTAQSQCTGGSVRAEMRGIAEGEWRAERGEPEERKGKKKKKWAGKKVNIRNIKLWYAALRNMIQEQ